MTINEATIEKVAAELIVRGGKLLRPGDLLVIDGGEVVYVDGMTLGDYFDEVLIAKYTPRSREKSVNIDHRPYYRRFERRHKRN